MKNPLDRMRLRKIYGGEEHQIRSAFGKVRHGGRLPAHQGWDLEALPGTFAYAVADSLVRDVNNDPNDGAGYGKYVLLEFKHSGVRYWALYAHLSEIFVKSSESVAEGKPIGKTGQTGREAARLPRNEAHLHFEMLTSPELKKGITNRVNPMQILATPQVFLRV